MSISRAEPSAKAEIWNPFAYNYPKSIKRPRKARSWSGLSWKRMSDCWLATRVPMDLPSYCDDLGRRARAAARELATVPGERKNRWLLDSAAALMTRSNEILQANARDLEMAADY